MEQSEQLFKAAGEIALASRPLLVFYGLSQAGRAIAAAALDLDDGHWQLEGHGLSIRSDTSPLPDVAVIQHGRPQASFRRLSDLLTSPSLPDGKTAQAVSLGQLWDALPEGCRRPLRADGERRPAMYFHRSKLVPHPLASGTVCGFPQGLTESSRPDEDFERFMSAYPHAAGYSMVLAVPDTKLPRFDITDTGRVDLAMHWDTGIQFGTEADQDARLATCRRRLKNDPLSPAEF
ncbi:hypothetical protein [Micromonospora sp. NPDC126480]|uniref:YaaC family protein n=1 Tax=Micromonospora sp. NPDC126480 TaxID=3155312 RepID=UPI00332AE293